MKRFFCHFLLPLMISCSGIGGRDAGELRIFFDDTSSGVTRSGMEIPDTSDFILSVYDSDGGVIYEGTYGDSPESFRLEQGNYIVKVVSEEFVKPAFSAPQFGDEQCVVVPGNGVVNVRLDCVQLNSGIRLRIDSGFLAAYPSAALLLKSGEGSLMYSYNERRIAYFKPGKVSLVMSQGAEDQVLMTRRLESQEVLSLGIAVASSGSVETMSEGLSISVDTSRYWLDETFVIGGSNGKGETESEAFTVSQAKASVGEEDVWVSGYIVGGDLTSAAASFDEPFTSRTNLLLGSRSSASARETCMSVQLPSGNVRDALNLVDNPQMLGRKVVLKGDIVEDYFGLVGLKNVTDFKVL